MENRDAIVTRALEAQTEANDELCALCLDVLSRQAEGKQLFAARDYAEVRAAEHGIGREDAELPSGNLLDLFARGAQTDDERALLSAMAVRAMKEHVGDRSRVKQFVTHADWLEVATPYVVYPFVSPILEDDKDKVFGEVAAALENNDDALAMNAVRLRALSQGGASPVSWSMIGDITAPATRALIKELGPVSTSSLAPGSVLRGEMSSPPPSGFWGALRLASGFAALSGIARLLGRAVGFRREAELSLVEEGVKLTEETRLLGRVVREQEETHAPRSFASVTRRERFPALHLLVGATALALGILLGGLYLFDGIRTGETVLLVLGAGIILTGALLDLGLSVLWPAKKGHVTVDMQLLPKRARRVSGVTKEEADKFVRAVRREIARVKR